MMTHIDRAVAAGGTAQVVGHATSPATRTGDDMPAGHVDRRRQRLLLGAMRGLQRVQEHIWSNPLVETAREERAADVSSRIKAAVAAGGQREMVARASGPTQLDGRRRHMLQDNGISNTGVSEGIRSIRQQQRAAITTSMIRQAVAGVMDVPTAIREAQAPPEPSGLKLAFRAHSAPPAAAVKLGKQHP